MRFAKISACLLALAAFGATPSTAHHSYSMFDMQRTIVLDATVVQFRWSNPHAFIRVNVQAGDEVELWSIEMTSPNNLVQEGWTRRTLRQGDRVQLYVHPLRSGAQGGSYAGVRLPDGSTLGEVE
ncbi:DUF6152 family protein [Aurantiacibacter sp. MUD11]|uniref:DUF6152 family protein n=1 Tax=Aurantiacibacter sp. MUD11 TaxID=3003265 RepID=UPI0022AADFE8|nr:DUF6152 family protein [Aurantiacibacter sp. MUD11]WAT18693.1 DUF6152 family protein [Aurantiacibacter sp. MUD11]